MQSLNSSWKTNLLRATKNLLVRILLIVKIWTRLLSQKDWKAKDLCPNLLLKVKLSLGWTPQNRISVKILSQFNSRIMLQNQIWEGAVFSECLIKEWIEMNLTEICLGLRKDPIVRTNVSLTTNIWVPKSWKLNQEHLPVLSRKSNSNRAIQTTIVTKTNLMNQILHKKTKFKNK